MVRVAINGFGRIGRSVLRALATTRAGEGVEGVLVNDVAPLDALADPGARSACLCEAFPRFLIPDPLLEGSS